MSKKPQVFVLRIYHADKQVKQKDIHHCLGKLKLGEQVVFHVEKREREIEQLEKTVRAIEDIEKTALGKCDMESCGEPAVWECGEIVDKMTKKSRIARWCERHIPKSKEVLQ